MIRRVLARALLVVLGALALLGLQPSAPASACGPSYGSDSSSLQGACPTSQAEWASAVVDLVAVSAVIGMIRLRGRTTDFEGRSIDPRRPWSIQDPNVWRSIFRRGTKGLIARIHDPGFLGRPVPVSTPMRRPPGGAPYDPSIAEQVPAWGVDDVKTRGILLVPGRGRFDIASSLKGFTQRVPRGPGSGLDANLQSHVEAHAGAALQPGEHGTLYLNRLPCRGGPRGNGCEFRLPLYVPRGAALTVYGPDGYSRLVIGERP